MSMIKIVCFSCNHKWEENIREGVTSVICPECLSNVPIDPASLKKMQQILSGTISADNLSGTSQTNISQDKAASNTPLGFSYIFNLVNSDNKDKTSDTQDANKESSSNKQSPALNDETRYKTPTPADNIHDTTSGIGKTVIKNVNIYSEEKTVRIKEDSAIPTENYRMPQQQQPDSQPNSQKDSSSTSDSRSKSRMTTGSAAPKDMNILVGQTIGGYHIKKMLGAGGMGAVFLAHQISLDRDVAIKVLPSSYAENPNLLARFTREALNAAQLTHHNIIQVYDVGSEDEIHYITMEYVVGKSIGDMVRQEGRLQIDDAVGYILQAARGLKYAHERGIIHRDIKPDNLMLNEHGIVKIADMGLAKMIRDPKQNDEGSTDTPNLKAITDSELTIANTAMGTPAYMAPEQASDSKTVDGRADQYSLGCTLYYLCAGRAPYSGKTAYEIITKHMKEPVIPLDVHVKHVPESIKAILNRMLEKDPANRYPAMEGVIKDLEAYLGVDSEKGPYTPREQHLNILDHQIAGYYGVKSLKKQKIVKSLFFFMSIILFFAGLLGGDFQLAGGFLGMVILTPAASFIINGILTKEYLFRRIRNVFFGMGINNWIMTIAGVVIFLSVLYLIGWLPYWIGFAVISIGLAAGYHSLFVGKVRKERMSYMGKMHEMLRDLRIKGVSEEALHDFISRFSDAHWEQFFEELFGYEEMIIARGKLASLDRVKPRKKYAVWRDPVAKWLEGIEEARKTARERKHLAKIEKAKLKAEGLSDKEAQDQAEVEATKIVTDFYQKREEELQFKAEEYDEKIQKARKKREPGFIGKVYAMIRGGIGLLLLAAYAIQYAGLAGLGSLSEWAPLGYYKWGNGGNVAGGIAALILLLSFLSKKIIMPTFILCGTIMLCFQNILIAIANQPHFKDTTAFMLGWIFILFALIVIGIAAMRNK